MYFGLEGVVADQRDAVGTLLTAMSAGLDSNVQWTVQTAGRELDDATGGLTGAWAESTAQTGVGLVAGNCVPDASQVLLRWKTTAIVNRRFVQGRTFIPGLSVLNVTEGNVAPAAVEDFSDAADALIDDVVLFGVWHRPSGADPGQFIVAEDGECWAELAVLRRRRG